MKRLSIALAALVTATLAAAGDEAASPASAPEAAAGEGNPLWAITSESLTATRDRPLFSPSRRPPAAVGVVAPPTAQTAAAETKPAAPERPPFKLLGTIVGAEARVALLRDRSNNAVLRLREGEAQSGWRAVKVAARSIVLGKAGDTVTLELPKPSDLQNDPSQDNAQAGESPSDGEVAAAAPAPTDSDAPPPPDGPRILPKSRH